MYKKLIPVILFSILYLFTIPCKAIELRDTPIQREFQNSILLASDNWDVGGNTEKSNNTLERVNSDRKKKSVFNAALYSALIPGLGELYVGHQTKAKVFFAVEVTTWLSYFAFHTYGDWKKDDMIRYASNNAGASLEGKDDEFFDWVGFYDSSEDFNTLGRVSDPDRAFLNSADTYWQWSSDAEREVFRSYKNSSRSAYDRANFMIMAAISSRIISIIDAIRDAKKYNTNEEKIDISQNNSYNYKLTINPLSDDKQVTLTLFTPF